MKTVFFGASKFVLPVITFLNKEHDLALVVTTEMQPTDAVPQYCIQKNIPYVSVSRLSELQTLIPRLTELGCPLGVLAYFGLIVTQSMIDIFPKGIINIHPSRLPLYRGATPGQTALVLGDVKTAVSIMLLDKEIDHGPLLAQEDEIISSTDTAVSLYERLFAKGVSLLSTVLPTYAAGTLHPVPQDHTKATFTKPLTRETGFIDPEKPVSPQLLDRMIRAYFPWPGVWSKMQAGNHEVRVKFLPNQMVQVEGKKPMSFKDFINGYEEGKKFLQKLNLV